MTNPLADVLGDRNPSLPLAIAALFRVADLEGAATFGALAVAYREDHLEVDRRGGHGPAQGGTLSVDEVRRYLLGSVLPPLIAGGLLVSPDDQIEDATPIAFARHRWEVLAPSREAWRANMLALAGDRLSATETVGTTPTHAGSIVTGTGLTKVYRRRRVVDNVDIELRQGEIVGLLGPNGAGKTTIFYMIVGLVRPDAGRIAMDGGDLSRLPMYRRAREGIGYLAQEPSIFRKLSVEENVLAILETLPVSRREREARLERLLDELTIKHLRTVPAYKLSGGERRRLEITRALVTEPKFMLLDEPFAGVDPIAVHDIQTIVASLRHRGIGVLITDHNVEQTLDIVDRAYIVFEGKVQVAGTVRELVFDDRVADLYLGPTLTARLRDRLGAAA
ncbi:MAG TPA: LPS export ABC transporter ATP-binding protein [Gemmatimonadales bacterium]